jgi:hypothetical protein
MPAEINTKEIVRQARLAGDTAAAKMLEVHGRLWEGRENLAKLIISLSSAILTGTITFSSTILDITKSSATCTKLIIVSWVFLFFSICFGILSLWHSNTLKSFRARFFNSEPEIKEDAAKLNPETNREELVNQVLIIVKKYSDAALAPLGSADKCANNFLNAALILFSLGLGAFLIFGALQVT